ncbi:hypothetical protein [Ruminiclostridium cellobioparum]|uniref:hypothetical protein n=1 Tax=Ruminiclostridium cellobioparum TaxID=29355 RepID=UPI00406BBC05
MVVFGTYQIFQLLTQQKIEIPAVHLARYGEGMNKKGYTVNFKTRMHFKDKKSRYPNGFGELQPLTELMIVPIVVVKCMFIAATTANANRNILALNTAKCQLESSAPRSTVNAEVVMVLAADMLKTIAEYSKSDRAEFIRTVQEAQNARQTTNVTKQKKRLAIARKKSCRA